MGSTNLLTTVVSLLKSIDKKLGKIENKLTGVLDNQEFEETLAYSVLEKINKNLVAFEDSDDSDEDEEVDGDWECTDCTTCDYADECINAEEEYDEEDFEDDDTDEVYEDLEDITDDSDEDEEDESDEEDSEDEEITVSDLISDIYHILSRVLKD